MHSSQSPLLISIVGPTGVGKTALSIRLAKKWETEILSCDACQFYRFMNIGTAKISEAERQQIPHHFLDILSPDENYNAGQFESEANKLLKNLFQSHDKVIMVGGSTLYAHALWNGIDEIPDTDPGIREALNHEFQQNGLLPLLNELEKADTETFHTIDKQNPIRVIRALEVFRTTGNPISFYRKKKEKVHFFKNLKFGLTMDRAKLYDRINQRVKEMIELGLIKEVESLMTRGYSPELSSMQAIGYKETAEYLQGKISYEEMIDKIAQHSRNYAKRQMTFFRRDKEIHWIDVSDTDSEKLDREISAILILHLKKDHFHNFDLVAKFRTFEKKTAFL